MQPTLIIDGTDFTSLVQSISPENNDLDADGSGRDISTGKMYRTKITDKDKLTVAMMRLWEDDMATLMSKLDSTYLTVRYLNPKTNTIKTGEMYNSSIKPGLQIYDRRKAKTFYEGATFELTER